MPVVDAVTPALQAIPLQHLALGRNALRLQIDADQTTQTVDASRQVIRQAEVGEIRQRMAEG